MYIDKDFYLFHFKIFLLVKNTKIVKLIQIVYHFLFRFFNLPILLIFCYKNIFKKITNLLFICYYRYLS